MSNSNQFFESLFKRKLTAPGTRDFLTQITNEYPYFSPAQFFLLLLTERGTAEFQLRAAKTSILFNNAYWLQFQLQEKQDPGEINGTIDEDKNKLAGEKNEDSISQESIELNKTQYNGEASVIDQQQIEQISGGETYSTGKEEIPLSTPDTAIGITVVKEKEIIPENEFEPVTGEVPGLFQPEEEKESNSQNEIGP
ncbi:MAG: hypothetical protein ABI760_20360, partial [Ferruginibacter sp.]